MWTDGAGPIGEEMAKYSIVSACDGDSATRHLDRRSRGHRELCHCNSCQWFLTFYHGPHHTWQKALLSSLLFGSHPSPDSETFGIAPTGFIPPKRCKAHWAVVGLRCLCRCLCRSTVAYHGGTCLAFRSAYSYVII